VGSGPAVEERRGGGGLSSPWLGLQGEYPGIKLREAGGCLTPRETDPPVAAGERRVLS
jgi:hypothetical protein